MMITLAAGKSRSCLFRINWKVYYFSEVLARTARRMVKLEVPIGATGKDKMT